MDFNILLNYANNLLDHRYVTNNMPAYDVMILKRYIIDYLKEINKYIDYDYSDYNLCRILDLGFSFGPSTRCMKCPLNKTFGCESIYLNKLISRVRYHYE